MYIGYYGKFYSAIRFIDCRCSSQEDAKKHFTDVKKRSILYRI